MTPLNPLAPVEYFSGAPDSIFSKIFLREFIHEANPLLWSSTVLSSFALIIGAYSIFIW